MAIMKQVERILAEKLLGISAIKLQPDNPFTWASGWNSPIYPDNRKALSYPAVRTFIKIELARVIAEQFPEAECVAGVATGAIAMGALVADELGLPYVFVRDTPKDHGLENIIEGTVKLGQKVVVVEDLVSTGKASLKACESLRQAGCEVVGMVSVFDFGFPQTEKAIRKAGVKLHSLTNFNAMLDVAVATDYIKEADIQTLKEWRDDPAEWSKR